MTFDFTVQDKDGRFVSGTIEVDLLNATAFNSPSRPPAYVSGLPEYVLKFQNQQDVVAAIHAVVPGLTPDEIVEQLREPVVRLAESVLKGI